MGAAILADGAGGVEAAGDLGAVAVEHPHAASAAVGHAGLAGHAHDGDVLGGAPVGAELLHGAGEGVQVLRLVAQPQHERVAGGDLDRLLEREGDVAGGVGAVGVDVAQGVAALAADGDGLGRGVGELEELELVGPDGVRRDLGDQQRAARGRGSLCGGDGAAGEDAERSGQRQGGGAEREGGAGEQGDAGAAQRDAAAGGRDGGRRGGRTGPRGSSQGWRGRGGHGVRSGREEQRMRALP